MSARLTAADLKRLAAEVSAQHGIRIDPDDPIMAVVTLNRLVFEAAIAQVLEEVQASIRDFETAAEKVQVRAGGALAQEVRECRLVMRNESERTLEEFRRREPESELPSEALLSWMLVVATLALAIGVFAAGMWIGNRLRLRY